MGSAAAGLKAGRDISGPASSSRNGRGRQTTCSLSVRVQCQPSNAARPIHSSTGMGVSDTVALRQRSAMPATPLTMPKTTVSTTAAAVSANPMLNAKPM